MASGWYFVDWAGRQFVDLPFDEQSLTFHSGFTATWWFEPDGTMGWLVPSAEGMLRHLRWASRGLWP